MTGQNPVARKLADEEREERILAEQNDPSTSQLAKISVDRVRNRAMQDAENIRQAAKSSGFPEDD